MQNNSGIAICFKIKKWKICTHNGKKIIKNILDRKI